MVGCFFLSWMSSVYEEARSFRLSAIAAVSGCSELLPFYNSRAAIQRWSKAAARSPVRLNDLLGDADLNRILDPTLPSITDLFQSPLTFMLIVEI